MDNIEFIKKRIVVTGVAGFIGFHVAKRLLDLNVEVVGIDNINDYYDQKLKEDRLAILHTHDKFLFNKVDLTEKERVNDIIESAKPLCVIHLAAQAGVRWSITNPWQYLESNISGFLSVLEACRHNRIKHLIYASSSSVYGKNENLPYSTSDSVNHPVSLYAATKKSNELMAHSYSHLYQLSCTGLRFFTVYGPWGRPDMAVWKFCEAICEGRTIDLNNFGKMMRDFTYIDDVVEAVVRLIEYPCQADPKWSSTSPDPATSNVPWQIFNIGNSSPTVIKNLVDILEKHLGKKAHLKLRPMQAGDVLSTSAVTKPLKEAVGFSPSTKLEHGLKKFVEWYLEYTFAGKNCDQLRQAG